MQQAIDQFRDNISRIRAIHGYYEAFSRQLTPAADISDILRAEIVMVVSALDHYVHEATRLGMIQAYEGKRPLTAAFLKYEISIESMLQTARGALGSTLLDEEVRARHTFFAFQQPDRIADAIRLYSTIELWPRVAAQLGDTVENIKLRLRLLIQRRNKIAHEADLDPSFPGSRWPIDTGMVANSVDFVSRLCEAIHSVTT
jgi:hypothetical protein